MKSKLIFALVLVPVLAACGGRSGARNAAQQNYETVEEGSAAGVTSTLQGPGETLPPITGTNADTTTAFALNPNAAPPPQASLSTLPPPMTSASASPVPQPRPAEPVPQPAAPEPAPATETAAPPTPPPATTTTQEQPKAEEPPPPADDTSGEQAEEPPPPPPSA